MEKTYADGSFGTDEMIEKPVQDARRFDEKSPINPSARRESDTHWLLDRSGDLHLRDKEGLIQTAKKTPLGQESKKIRRSDAVTDKGLQRDAADSRTSGCVTFKGDTGFRSVIFSPDGKLLATVAPISLRSLDLEWSIKLWDAMTGEAKGTFRGYTSLVESVTFSPDGTLLASGSVDATIRLWDVKMEFPTKSGHGVKHYSARSYSAGDTYPNEECRRLVL